jgi:neurofibromin 1
LVFNFLHLSFFFKKKKDTANAWKARWMGLVTSTAFYFNPAIQPRSFVTLGCLAQEDVDDDLIYQILVALKGALAIFNESESSLIVSIMMCLGSIIENLPEDSHYLIHLFWLAIALVHIGHPETFQASVQFLQSVLCALDARKAFVYRPMEEVLLDAKYQLGSIGTELGRVAGVNFDEHFSFAVTVILLRGGLKSAEYKETVYQCLTAFLEISCKQTTERDFIDVQTLGYLAGLLPFATKEDTLHELLRLAGINEMDLEDYGMSHIGLFNLLDIPDDDTALLLVSFLVTLLNTSESEIEKLSLYSLLADAAKSAPGVFSLV